MSKIKQYLKKNNISIYKLSKNTNISYATVYNIVNDKVNIKKCEYGIIEKIAHNIGINTDDFVKMCNSCYKFYIFRSEQQHLVHRKGELQYIIDVLENKVIDDLWEKSWELEAMYVLAMIDYLCRRNGIPKYNGYADIRACKCERIVYPVDIELECHLQNNPALLSQYKYIPEFMEFNIAEGGIFNE